jgi:hypothetical protein
MLASAVEKPLEDLISEEERRTRELSGKESPELRRSLDALGRELARLVDEDLRELEEEGLGGGEDIQASPMRLIPEHAVIYSGEDKTISLQVRADFTNGQPILELDPEGVVELISGSTVTLTPHKTRPHVLSGQIHVRPLVEGEQSILTASYCGHSTAALLEVRPERIVDEIPIPPPETLQFEKNRYQLAWTKKKCIRILAPVELVATEGKNVRIESTDAGIVVLGKGVALTLDEDLEYYTADVTVEARRLGSKTTLRAKLGGVSAECAVVVAREEGGPTLRIKFDSTPAGNFRAIVEPEGEVVWIKIMAEHPAIKRYLGPAPEYLGKDLIASKTIVAEIVAG